MIDCKICREPNVKLIFVNILIPPQKLVVILIIVQLNVK